jgi:hypothetical protein
MLPGASKEVRQVLPQTAMIERVRELCQQDERVVAAMLYGSFTRGEGDQFSDIEFVVFVSDAELSSFNQQDWNRIFPPKPTDASLRVPQSLTEKRCSTHMQQFGAGEANY